MRKPKILLLDEATSSLDSENEKVRTSLFYCQLIHCVQIQVVLDAINQARMDRTCITIAHRLTTIQDCDVICVLHNGKIVEIGRHANLMEKRGLYFQYYLLQE